jgi:hypothetical protein
MVALEYKKRRPAGFRNIHIINIFEASYINFK